VKTRKLTFAAMLVALGVAVCNFVYFPVGASKCTPMQHIINVLAAVVLGPGYAVLTAFSISLLRNMMGVGTLLAFPGSMVGAFLAGILFKKTNSKFMAVLGEIIGTGILGALIAYPVAKFMLGKDVAALFFVYPFLINTVVGSIFAFLILKVIGLSRIFPVSEKEEDGL